jgi:Na+/H+-dicarboxylate symporter
MGRTAVNVTGNCLATVIGAKWEKVFDRKDEAAVGEGRSPNDDKTLSEASA